MTVVGVATGNLPVIAVMPSGSHPGMAESYTDCAEMAPPRGWTFRARRRVREFLYLRLRRTLIRATGSGIVRVTTPPTFRPGATPGWRAVTATIVRP